MVRDFEVGLERVHEEPNGFLLQCSSHLDVHIAGELIGQRIPEFLSGELARA